MHKEKNDMCLDISNGAKLIFFISKKYIFWFAIGNCVAEFIWWTVDTTLTDIHFYMFLKYIVE